MKTIYAHPGQALKLGRRGENEARQIVFDLTTWTELYGAGVAQLIHQRAGDATPYPAILLQTDTEAIWTLSDADTAIEGEGKAELQYLVGDQLAKSCTWQTFTDAALGDPGDPPEPEKSWVDQVLQAGVTAQQAAQRAEEVAAQLNDVEAQVKAASAAAASAQTSASNASTSEKNAADSATRAENAAQGVETTLAELEAAMAAI